MSFFHSPIDEIVQTIHNSHSPKTPVRTLTYPGSSEPSPDSDVVKDASPPPAIIPVVVLDEKRMEDNRSECRHPLASVSTNSPFIRPTFRFDYAENIQSRELEFDANNIGMGLLLSPSSSSVFSQDEENMSPNDISRFRVPPMRRCYAHSISSAQEYFRKSSLHVTDDSMETEILTEKVRQVSLNGGRLKMRTRKRSKMLSPPTQSALGSAKKQKHLESSCQTLKTEIKTSIRRFDRCQSMVVAKRFNQHNCLDESDHYDGYSNELIEILEDNFNRQDKVYSLPAALHPFMAATAYRNISGHTLIEEMIRLGDRGFNSKYLLIDCRFPYEYRGGHIRNAINIPDEPCMLRFFFPDEPNEKGIVALDGAQQMAAMAIKIPIFYCEYSQKRGPTRAYGLRHHDRVRHSGSYPSLFYGEVYLLDRGYRLFFQNAIRDNNLAFCTPPQYVPMIGNSEQLKYFRKTQSFNESRMQQRPGLNRTNSIKKLFPK